MTVEINMHPDMDDLIAAKQAVTRTTESGVLRSDWNAYGERLGRPYPEGMKVRDFAIDRPASDPGKIKLRLYRPADAAPGGPCTMYLHGGAFVKGSLDSGDSNAWGIAAETGAVVVSVDYRLAPENPYPAPVHDTLYVLDYLCENAAELGIDARRIAFWGDSAGANLSAGASLMARDRGGNVPVAQVLVYGVFSNDCTSSSYIDFAEVTPGHTTEALHRAWRNFLGGQDIFEATYAAPLKVANLSGIAPAFVHYAEYDPLADDSIAYVQRLTEAGISATLRCAKRMIHGFLRARFSGSTAEAEFALPCMFLRGIFAAKGPNG